MSGSYDRLMIGLSLPALPRRKGEGIGKLPRDDPRESERWRNRCTAPICPFGREERKKRAPETGCSFDIVAIT